MLCEQEEKPQRTEIILNKKTSFVLEIAFSPMIEEQIQPLSKSKDDA